MAASLARRRFCKCKSFWTKPLTRNASTAYYVLLPEIPPDTPETNPLLRVKENPDFQKLSPLKIRTGAAKVNIEYETQLGQHLEDLQDAKADKDFSTVLEPIEKITVPLNYAWRTAKHLNYVHHNAGYRHVFQQIHPQVERSKNERWISEPLYNAVKAVKGDHPNMPEFQSRLVDMYLLEARLNGIELTGAQKKRFIDTLRKLAQEKDHFRNKVMICNNVFSHTITDFRAIAEMPKPLVQAMSLDKQEPHRGPWKVTLQHGIYYPFLEHCSDRMTRWNVWHAYNNRAGVEFNEQNLANHKLIGDLRMYRRDIANMLGYENFAQMSMETKMAGTVENVISMIESLKNKFKDSAHEEIAELQKFAISEGFGGEIQMWDVAYWRNRQKEHLYKLDEGEVAQYFPLPSVLDGLFGLCQDLFGIQVKECTPEVETWHPDVSYYRISNEAGENVAAFYVDPYARPSHKLGGAWMEVGRERSDVVGTQPISYLNLNLASPVPGRPALMTFTDVATLFHEFGHGLQQLLTTVPYSEIAGQRNVEWDALQICATFMQRLLHRPDTIQRISKHQDTGKPMPQQLIQDILNGQKHMSSYDMMRQLYFSAYDMEIYVSKGHWYEVMQKVWAEFMPIPHHEDDNHPASLTHIFSDQYPAAYYSYKWSQMVSADILAAFEEANFDDPAAVQAVGRKFRDTFLSLGGGVPAGEIFRRFRGRDPTVDALLNQHGLLSAE